MKLVNLFLSFVNCKFLKYKPYFVFLLPPQAKDAYHARCIECEKLKKEGITGKDLEKAEAKNKKASE